MLPNREELLERVSEAVRRAGALFGDRELAEQIRRKGVTDFVTQVDLTVQEQLRGALRAIAPDSPYYRKARNLEAKLMRFEPLDPALVPEESMLREFLGREGLV